MNKKINQFVMALSIIFALMLSPVFVHAVTETETEGTATATTTSPEDAKKSAETKKAERNARLEEHKKNLKEKLTTAAQARITERCVAAQGFIKGKTTSNTVVTAARQKAYSNIITKLNTLITTAQEKNVDTTVLEDAITQLKAKISTFNTVNEEYQDTLLDLKDMDCKADPTAFKATLEAARSAQKEVFNAAKDIRAYLNETVKVAAQTIKDGLENNR